MLVAVLAGALVASSGVVVLVRDERRLAASDDAGEATADVALAVSALAEPVSAARMVLADSAGQVDDEQVRSVLATAVADALDEARSSAATVDDLAVAEGALRSATDAVGRSVARWELARARDRWAAAESDLDTALVAARGAFDSSAGRVADDAVRQALAAAIASAQATHDGPAPADAAGLTAAATALAGATASLVGPQTAVDAAVAAWQEAQATAAAEAAKAAAKRATTAPKPASSTGTPVNSEGHWETAVTYEELRICGDTEGNSWEC